MRSDGEQLLAPACPPWDPTTVLEHHSLLQQAKQNLKETRTVAQQSIPAVVRLLG